MNFFNQGVPLGRWFGIRVLVHWTFLLWAAFELYPAFQHGGAELGLNVIVLGLLFGTVLVHEFGHALSCKAMGGIAQQIILWPLGGIAFVQPPNDPWAWLITTVCGPLVNAILWPLFWWITVYGLPLLAHHIHFSRMGFEYTAFICEEMWQINRLLLLFNLIPAYPMDGGRILQEILWFIVGFGRSLQIAGMIGTVAGLGFIVLGLGLTKIHIPFIDLTLGGEGSEILLVIGILVAMQSFGIYKRSQEILGYRKA